MAYGNFPDSIELSKLNRVAVKEKIKELEVDLVNNADMAERIITLLKSDSRKGIQELGEEILRLCERHGSEVRRVRAMYDFDMGFGNCQHVAGVDEVGRGPLAGPIVAAAVILDLRKTGSDELILGLNDSKKLTPKRREELSEIIKKNAVSFSIARIEAEDIDISGISFCNNKAFKEACQGLSVVPQLVLTDGYPIKGSAYKNEYVIKGDTKSASIAAASIIAKVYRDNLMAEYGKLYEGYGFENNAGYGTKEHLDGISRFGISPIHRKSFLKGILEKEA